MIRRKEADLLDNHVKGAAAGLNESIFSAASDVMQAMRPKNGVKIRKNKAEFGSGRYINTNRSKMSLAQYTELADQHKSLATIALRGASQTAGLDALAADESFLTADAGHSGRSRKQ